MDPYWRPDVRWYSVTRREPEPIFSLGLLAYPFRDRLEKLFVGGTYQTIYKEEPYYTVPVWIYDSRMGYDPFNEKDEGPVEDIPIEVRYYGEDVLSTQAHLFSAFTGYPVSDRVDFGLSINTVCHSRDGSYVNSRADEYGNTNNRDYRYYDERGRDQDYHHFDISGGLRYAVTEDFTAGLKIGRLSGEADQEHHDIDSSRYEYGDSLQESYWSHYYSYSRTNQEWNRDGRTWYTRLSFDHQLERNKRVSGYYRYSKSDADLDNTSMIADTSYSRSWSYYSYYNREYRYQRESSASDVRTGTGRREEQKHQGMINLKWKVTRKSRVSLGFFFSHNETDLSSTEPAIVDRWSEYNSTTIDTTIRYTHRYHREFEDKRLEWQYRSKYWSVQIPVFLRHRFNQNFSLLLGVNRILKSWDISEQTKVYFARREKTDRGETKVETNFAEWYLPADKKYTEDYTAVSASFEVAVSPQFQIRLMLDPETEDDFKINQWWLSFQLKM